MNWNLVSRVRACTSKYCVSLFIILLSLSLSSPFATLIHVNRWRNWGKGLPWIGAAVEGDRPFRNFISTRLHLRDSFLHVFSFKMLSEPGTSVAVVKNDRSKSDRPYFAEKRNFILSWNSLTNAFFIVVADRKTGTSVAATKFHGT